MNSSPPSPASSATMSDFTDVTPVSSHDGHREPAEFKLDRLLESSKKKTITLSHSEHSEVEEGNLSPSKPSKKKIITPSPANTKFPNRVKHAELNRLLVILVIALLVFNILGFCYIISLAKRNDVAKLDDFWEERVEWIETAVMDELHDTRLVAKTIHTSLTRARDDIEALEESVAKLTKDTKTSSNLSSGQAVLMSGFLMFLGGLAVGCVLADVVKDVSVVALNAVLGFFSA